MTNPANETFTYADGTQVVGSPPFPKLSPLERAEQGAAEPAAVTGNTITADDLQSGAEAKTSKAKK